MNRLLLVIASLFILGAGCSVESRTTRDLESMVKTTSTPVVEVPKSLTKKFVFQKQVGFDGGERQYPIIDILTSDSDGSNLQTVVHKADGSGNYSQSIMVVPTRNAVILNTEHSLATYDLTNGATEKIVAGDASNSYIFSQSISKDEKSLYFARFKGSYGQINVPVELYEYHFETKKLNLLATVPRELVNFHVVTEMVLSPDRGMVYLETGTASEQPPQLRVFDIRTKTLSTLAEGLQSTILVSNDGTKIAYSEIKQKSLKSYINDMSGSFDPTEIHILRLGDNAETSKFENANDSITPIKWSQDGTELLIATETPKMEQPFCPNEKVTVCCQKSDECPMGVVGSETGYGLFSFINGTLTSVLDPSPLQKKWDPIFVARKENRNAKTGVAFTLDNTPFFDESLTFLGAYFIEK